MNNTSTALWSHIRTGQNFPKPGICFFDLTPLFMSNIGPLTDALIESIPAEQLAEVDSFVAVEARGFVLQACWHSVQVKVYYWFVKQANYHHQLLV